MPRKTVLDLTKALMSKLEFDEIVSIGDTQESENVARIIRACYRDIASEMDHSHQGDLVKLESATDPDHPVLLKMPDRFERVDWINYTQSAKLTQNQDIADAVANYVPLEGGGSSGDGPEIVDASLSLQDSPEGDAFSVTWETEITADDGQGMLVVLALPTHTLDDVIPTSVSYGGIDGSVIYQRYVVLDGISNPTSIHVLVLFFDFSTELPDVPDLSINWSGVGWDGFGYTARFLLLRNLASGSTDFNDFADFSLVGAPVYFPETDVNSLRFGFGFYNDEFTVNQQFTSLNSTDTITQDHHDTYMLSSNAFTLGYAKAAELVTDSWDSNVNLDLWVAVEFN